LLSCSHCQFTVVIGCFSEQHDDDDDDDDDDDKKSPDFRIEK